MNETLILSEYFQQNLCEWAQDGGGKNAENVQGLSELFKSTQDVKMSECDEYESHPLQSHLLLQISPGKL